MFKYLFTCVFVFTAGVVEGQRLQVSENGRFLVTENGEPFFWMADTSWELFHRCNREEAELYLKKRAEQGFNVIQAVVLAELDGLNTPNSYGEKPLIENDPTQPNEAYFEHVDYVIRRAKEQGLYISLLPTWGDKVNLKSWGTGPVIFNPQKAYKFGQWIGQRYKDEDHIIWVIGGDRNPREDTTDIAIWNQLAEGIAQAAGGYERTLMSFHPQPKEGGGSSSWFHHQKWLDFNMHQTGHCANQGTYNHIAHDYALTPTKPVIDAEPLYEDHPNCFNAKELGHSLPEDIRRIMYWNVFAGAFGQTYGCHDVWQMYLPDREPVNQPLRPWPAALNLPMANQVKHLKHLMLSRPFLSRIPDQTIIVGHQEDNQHYKIATRDIGGRYAMVYLPTGGSCELNLDSLTSNEWVTWWYDPRTGHSFKGEKLTKQQRISISAPTQGQGHDWVLIVDDPKASFKIPGTSD
ncbi:MAG: hypothetical protein CML04_05680 [Pseudozobellia sp.]|nr:hypothetical protein [Pseudozobellia sp.]MBG47888.1 hypothetical protein [Pseudozobellia sp.]|tara:strand:+ start:930484 stop:931869 length:1386 start_codon:yes stop_codon:yes gene_type:complete